MSVTNHNNIDDNMKMRVQSIPLNKCMYKIFFLQIKTPYRKSDMRVMLNQGNPGFHVGRWLLYSEARNGHRFQLGAQP